MSEFTNSTLAPIGFYVPSMKYALVMQLAHIKEHFFGVGIGLRQLVDYYMLLKHSSAEDCAKVAILLKNFGLWRMAQAVMWLLRECLGLSEEFLLCKPGEWRGKRLLNVILTGGNFGYHDVNFAGPHMGVPRRVWKSLFQKK